jgi:heme exporter protein A
MLISKNVTCQYNNRIIFEDVNINLGQGALVILHGPNGSGKTSFLKILAGINTSWGGDVLWNDRPITDAIQDDELRINYLGHSYAVKPELTVLENIEFWAELAGNPAKIEEALEIFGLTAMANLLCSDLSSGWQKRVALARLVCCPANAWLLDEPYNNLDVKISGVLDKLIVDYAKAGGIVMLSSHTLVPIEKADKLNIAAFAPSGALAA